MWMCLSKIFCARVDGVFLVNNDCSSLSLINAYIYAKQMYPKKWIGLNYLGNCYEAMGFAKYLNVDGLWMDNIGVFDDNVNRAKFIQSYIDGIDFRGLLFGGICFKYQVQPQSPEITAKNASRFAHIITTTGKGNSHPVEIEKVRQIYNAVNNTNFIAVASGISPENIREILPYVNVFMMHSSVINETGLFDKLKLEQLVQIVNEHKS